MSLKELRTSCKVCEVFLLPEFLQGAFLVGEEEAQQSLPLQKDDRAGYQEADQGDQDRHGDDHAVG